jgi:short-subunit dehydrogenase
MMNQLNTKRVALVTGASSGIGEATAILLASSGYRVYATARRSEKMQHLKVYNINIIKLDVSNDLSILNALSLVIEYEGAIHILVNNAGFGYFGAVEDMGMNDARYQLEVNLFGAARLCQLVLPYMRRQGFGKIVNVTSVGGKVAAPLSGWYHASKFALEGLSDSLRQEVKQFGVDVILIEPGSVKTEWRKIAMIHAFTVSGDTTYRHMTAKAEKLKTRGHVGTAPTEIAALIKMAIEARRPKARYCGGYMAGPILFLKKWLSDRAFDRLIMKRWK